MKILLNGKWGLNYRKNESVSQWISIDAEVPGNVELDLMREGLLPDLTKGDNIYAALELERNEWIYSRSFSITPDFDRQDAELVFEGIDCLAEIKLNGQALGKADNMFIEHRFAVGDLLRADSENLLEVHISSAVKAGMAHELSPDTFAQANNWETLRIRKAGHMYGWDIAPRIVSAGLWRGVRLETIPANRFRSVYVGTVETDAVKHTAKLMVDWNISANQLIHDLSVAVSITDSSRDIHTSVFPCLGTHGRQYIDLNEIELWWPRGYGNAKLYDITLQILDCNGEALAEYREKLGLRTVKLRRTEITSDAKDGDFSFIVNGERIFIKGTNWVPLDALHSRDKQHLAKTMEMALDLNCNMLRCWGGNVYEDHDFFELCDRNGILVWQDFALACAAYPQDDEFKAQIHKEAESVIKKLRNHPSLALWSGNNEIDELYAEWTPLKRDPNVCDRLSREVLPAAVRTFDPLRDYLPSSPYFGPELMALGVPHSMKPEAHLWGPRDNFKGPFYMSSNAHFVSEIGYHGCPNVESMKEMLDTDKLWPWRDNDQWLTKAVRPLPRQENYNYRIPLMANQISVLFEDIPNNLEDFILASQISQAEALKFFIEKWRSEKEFRSGILWWNLRDCWPIISDAIVDYYYRKKLAYTYVKTSQTDISAMITEAERGNHKLMVVNDTPKSVSGRISVYDADSKSVLFQGAFEVSVNGVSTVSEISAVDIASMWLIRMDIDNSSTEYVNHYLAGPRPFCLEVYKKWLKQIID